MYIHIQIVPENDSDQRILEFLSVANPAIAKGSDKMYYLTGQPAFVKRVAESIDRLQDLAKKGS